MQEIKLVFFGCVVCIGFTGCQFTFNSVPGSGISASEDRAIDSFDRLSFSGSGTAIVNCGEDASLSITTDDNLLELIKSEVSGGKLSIYSTENISPNSGKHCEISTDTLNELTVNGSAEFEINNCQSDTIKLRINGSGKIAVTGTVENLDVTVTGSGRADLSKLSVDSATVSVVGSGRVNVDVSKTLDASVTGSGRINYSGPADVKTKVVGSGSVRQLKTAANSNGIDVEESDQESDENDDEETDTESTND